MLKTILKYAFIGGTAVVLWLNIVYAAGIMYSDGWLGYLSTLTIVIMPLTIFLALRELKRKHLHGRLHIGYALGGGLLIAFVAGLLYCLFLYADVHYMNFRMYGESIRITEQQMLQTGKSAKEVEETVAGMKAYYYSLKPYVNILLGYIKLGAIYSLAAFGLLQIRWKKSINYENTDTSLPPQS